MGASDREQQVRVFVKQLLTALQYMHSRNMAHLDLRPEAVLLQDDHLILADFGENSEFALFRKMFREIRKLRPKSTYAAREDQRRYKKHAGVRLS